MKPFYVYILKCNDHSYYTGHTDNLEKRLNDHIDGFCNYTAAKLPIKLVFSEQFTSLYEALAAERKLKKWTHRKKKLLIEHGWEKIKGYSSADKKKNILRLGQRPHSVRTGREINNPFMVSENTTHTELVEVESNP